MRLNFPITQREFPFPSKATLVSVTDLKGRITYCNSAFVRVSGYSRDELLGQSHNIVRHPDMPEEAFRDLWATIQAGRPWCGLVKNRRKDGDHYWVRANATPLKSDDRIVGYLSVRSIPSREEVAAAEALYARMRQEAANGRVRTMLQAGQVTRRDFIGRVAHWWKREQMIRIAAAVVGACVLTQCAATLLPWFWSAPSALALAMLATWTVQRLAMAPVISAVEDANRLASCDLSRELRVSSGGVFGDLQQALVQMSVNLRTVIGDVRSEIVTAREAVVEIAAGSQDLSARTESQASSLEQTAASMEEVNSTIQNSASAADESARLAAGTADMAQRSHESVQAAARAMEQIRDSSRRMQEIIQVIEGVSFQTNILALNAAVEAARAGEQGRGFAVVAAEVRALAQRSAAAAREIKALISEASTRVDAGSVQTAGAGDRMKEVLEAASGVKKLLMDITVSATEQRSGVNQISEAVMQLDSITQQNAALVEQLSAASASVRDRMQSISDTMDLFRLEAEDSSIAQIDAVELRRRSKEHSES